MIRGRRSTVIAGQWAVDGDRLRQGVATGDQLARFAVGRDAVAGLRTHATAVSFDYLFVVGRDEP